MLIRRNRLRTCCAGSPTLWLQIGSCRVVAAYLLCVLPIACHYLSCGVSLVSVPSLWLEPTVYEAVLLPTYTIRVIQREKSGFLLTRKVISVTGGEFGVFTLPARVEAGLARIRCGRRALNYQW